MRRHKWFSGLLGIGAAAVLAVPVALAAKPNPIQPAQRVDMKVLLLSADGTEATFTAWKAQLAREGVPYDAIVADAADGTITDDRLADYGADHAKYQAVILATGDLVHPVTVGTSVTFPSALSDAEWASLARFEKTFGIRQISDFTTPAPIHGLNFATNVGKQDGLAGALTTDGKAAFPYLNGPVQIEDADPAVDEAFGYQATPVNTTDFDTLVTGPNNSSYLGVYTHPEDGREEMVMTVVSNENQLHAQLLRHGMLNWATRGVFLGFQRNYLELQVDDLFLGDDAWNPTLNVTDYDPATASRMTPADVTKAVNWSQTHGLRLDFAYNGGGVDLYKSQNNTTVDPLQDAFKVAANRNAFGYINHTFEHPNLNCSTQQYIGSQISRNVTFATQNALPINPSELVTGEHSGLANTKPGNPGSIDPPGIEDPVISTGGTLPAGTYQWGVTAQSKDVAANETPASVTADVTVGATTDPAGTLYSAQVPFNVVCGAVRYNLYRKLSSATTWTKVGTLASAANAPTDNGTAEIDLTITDTGAAGTAANPPATNTAVLDPYGQNPALFPALVAAGIKNTASDASKAYPDTSVPANAFAQTVTGAQVPPGATFFEGTAAAGFQAIPRYPMNVYYNVSKQGQQLDEYNWIYWNGPGTGTDGKTNDGACTPIPNVTTCRTAPATWADYVSSENRIMFRHIMGNDPRPHYVHQSNLADYNAGLAETDPNQGGILYPVIGGLLTNWYDKYFNRTVAPLVQLNETQIADTMNQQSTWAKNLAAGKLTAWLQDGEVHVKNADAAAISVPLTGTTVGGAYGGQKSGWDSIPAGGEKVYKPNDPASTSAPTVSGSTKVGSTLSATRGGWTGTPTLSYGYQWQRCNGQGAACANIPGATGETYVLQAADKDKRVRAVVSAGNWVSSVSMAASAVTATVDGGTPAATRPSTGTRNGGQSGAAGGKAGAKAKKLALTKLKMSPKRFAVAHKKPLKAKRKKSRGPDGSIITWRLNKNATVRLTIQRLAGTKKHPRWVKAGTLKRKARAGAYTVRFTGRFGRKFLAPRKYRVVIVATAGKEKVVKKPIAFRVVKG